MWSMLLPAVAGLVFIWAADANARDRGVEGVAGTGRTVGTIVLAQRRSCRAASSCEEAVEMWCNGYRGADGDGDGIPCENVCRSRSQVDKIKEEIGC